MDRQTYEQLDREEYLPRPEYKRQLKEKKSKARRIRTLIKRQKKLFKTIDATTDFKEPVLFFIRTNGRVELYENATSGYFEYAPTNAEKGSKMMKIMLDPAKQQIMDYGTKSFRCYFHREGDAVSYPHIPLLDVEAYNISQQKTLNDLIKHEATKIKAQAIKLKSIAWIVAALLAGLALWGMLAPQTMPWNQPEQVVRVIENTAPTVLGGIVGIKRFK